MPEPDAFSDIMTALQRGILLRRENPTYRYWPPVAAARHGFKMVLFTVSRRNTFVGGTCTPSSALPVEITDSSEVGICVEAMCIIWPLSTVLNQLLML